MDSTLSRVVKKIKTSTDEADEKDLKLLKLQNEIEEIIKNKETKLEYYETTLAEIEVYQEKLFAVKSEHEVKQKVSLPAVKAILKEKEEEVERVKSQTSTYKEKVKDLQRECFEITSMKSFENYQKKIQDYINETIDSNNSRKKELEHLKEQYALKLEMDTSRKELKENISKSQMLNDLLQEKIQLIDKDITSIQNEMIQERMKLDSNNKEMEILNQEIKKLKMQGATELVHTSSQIEPKKEPEVVIEDGKTSEKIGNTDFVLASNLPKSKFKFRSTVERKFQK